MNTIYVLVLAFYRIYSVDKDEQMLNGFCFRNKLKMLILFDFVICNYFALVERNYTGVKIASFECKQNRVTFDMTMV